MTKRVFEGKQAVTCKDTNYIFVLITSVHNIVLGIFDLNCVYSTDWIQVYATISAASILSAMDRTVDPCVDFFQYACGTWNKMHVIPEDRSSISTFEVMSDQLQVILKGNLYIKKIRQVAFN